MVVAIVIQDKQYYVKGERQLYNYYFYEETETDLTGEVIHKQYVTEGTNITKLKQILNHRHR